METKICRFCHKKKTLKEFNFSKRHKSGKQTFCKECNRKKSKKYYDDNALFRAKRKLEKHASDINIKKYRARRHINNRIRKGRLVRGCCIICNNPSTEAHRLDYNDRTNIQWLCKSHHHAWHRIFISEGEGL